MQVHVSLRPLIGPLMLIALVFPAVAQEKNQKNSPAQGVWKQVNDTLGRQGELESPGVWKYDVTRDDLKVKVNGSDIKPELALDGWITFQQTAGKARMMGELVLTSDEINPVMGKLQEAGVQVMAVHNHLTGESPEVMYMHIMSEGDILRTAHTLHDALALTKTPAQEQENQENQEPVKDIDSAQIQRIIGGEKEQDRGVLELNVPRRDRITEGGQPIPPAMEVASEAKFQPTGNGQAILYGEIVLTASEVNPVLRSLRQNGVEVMALHNHMLTEQPRLFFVHCLAQGDAVHLAHAIREAFDLTNAEKAGGK